MSRSDWTTLAACKGRTADFYPKSPGRGNVPHAWKEFHARIQAAIATCNTCPVLDACKEYAQDASLGHGVWAGQYQGHDFRRGVNGARQAKEPHKCPGCGKQTRAAMCKGCRYPKRPAATCAVCGATFQPREGRAGKYCSRDCYRTIGWANDRFGRSSDAFGSRKETA